MIERLGHHQIIQYAEVMTTFLIMHLQAHHLDLEFYDTFFKPGAYLRTHAQHMKSWHAGEQG
jgi:hypothetical protein